VQGRDNGSNHGIIGYLLVLLVNLVRLPGIIGTPTKLTIRRPRKGTPTSPQETAQRYLSSVQLYVPYPKPRFSTPTPPIPVLSAPLTAVEHLCSYLVVSVVSLSSTIDNLNTDYHRPRCSFRSTAIATKYPLRLTALALLSIHFLDSFRP
jgi:hypothetical protein